MINYIDSSDKPECNNVKFISYTGEYPNLCRGILTLEIDGEEVRFGHDYSSCIHSWEHDPEGKLIADGNYDSFWESGGCAEFDSDGMGYTNCGDWLISESDMPEKYRKYIREIDSLFNGNVRHGCCGGCL